MATITYEICDRCSKAYSTQWTMWGKRPDKRHVKFDLYHGNKYEIAFNCELCEYCEAAFIALSKKLRKEFDEFAYPKG
jgi:hypothetical protein